MSRRSARNAVAASEALAMQASQTHLVTNIQPSSSLSSNIYLQNYYGHPSNTRLLIGNMSQNGGKRRGRSSAMKPPKPPEKPAIPYMRYSRKVWDDVKVTNPELKLWEIGKIVGQMWRELPAADRQQFIEEYEMEKMEHAELLKAYYVSPAYQAYLHAKSRDDAIEAAAEGLGGDKDDAYMSIEPVDDSTDDSDMIFSVKHVAAARFQRNHRLINDILGEAVTVPSTRAVVTTQRWNVLKNQVNSLEQHQKKLEGELIHLEESHNVRKRKWVDQARDFGKEMKRLRAITPQEYYKEYKIRQQQQAAAQQKQLEEARKEKLAKEKAEESKKNEEKEKQKEAEKQEENKESAESESKDTTEPSVTEESKEVEAKEEKMETEEEPIANVEKSEAPEEAVEKTENDEEVQKKDDENVEDAQSKEDEVEKPSETEKPETQDPVTQPEEGS